MRILSVKEDTVTRGVLDKVVHTLPHLIEVTFMDGPSTPRTVFAHKDGPFSTPEEIAQAAIDGVLHERPDDEPPQGPPVPPAGEVVAGGPRGGEADKAWSGQDG